MEQRRVGSRALSPRKLESITEEQVLASGRLLVVGRSSGLETEVAVFHVWTVQDDLVVRLLVFDERQSALDAAAR
jgi:hypothetical protein